MLPRYAQLVESQPLPPVALIRQHFDAAEAGDPASAVVKALALAPEMAAVRPGMSVALTVGSRGIARLPDMVRAIVTQLQARGAHPFIVPSMGSHGGATAEGQLRVLAHLGVTEDSAGCPIHSSMETICLGRLDNGMEVHVDKLAHQADGIVLFNRIKPHSAFRALNESGLVKMLSIGLGKQSGADNCHAWGFTNVGRFIIEMARVKLAACKILFGVGVLENAYDRLAKVVVLPPEGLIEREREYLAEAMRGMPRLPLGPLDQPMASGPLDVLVVDYVGKEFSGSGMDPNITGRPSTKAISGGPSVSRIAVLDVTDKSEGNANGVARADVITERLFRRFDRESVYINSVTSGVLSAAAIPMAMPTDRTAIQTAVKTCESQTPEAITLIRIPNTLDLQYLYASEALLPALRERPGIEILTPPLPMRFDADGRLLDSWPDHGG